MIITKVTKQKAERIRETLPDAEKIFRQTDDLGHLPSEASPPGDDGPPGSCGERLPGEQDQDSVSSSYSSSPDEQQSSPIDYALLDAAGRDSLLDAASTLFPPEKRSGDQARIEERRGYNLDEELSFVPGAAPTGDLEEHTPLDTSELEGAVHKIPAPAVDKIKQMIGGRRAGGFSGLRSDEIENPFARPDEEAGFFEVPRNSGADGGMSLAEVLQTAYGNQNGGETTSLQR